MRIRLHILTLVMLLCFGTARAQLAQTTVDGVLHDLSGAANPHGELHVYEVRKAGAIISTGDLLIRTNSNGEALDPATKTPGFKLPRNSTVRVFSTAPGLNSCRAFTPCSAEPSNGVWLTVPDASTANLEDLVSVALVPSTGLIVKDEGTALGGLYGTLNFVGAGVSVAGSGGAAVVTINGGSVNVDWPDITNKPSMFAPTAHASAHAAAGGDPLTLSQSQITGLTSALAGKAAASHIHSEGDVTGLAADLAAKQDALGFTPVPTTRTVNGHALSGNVSVTPGDLNLVIGTNTQAHSGDLDAIAGLSPSSDDVLQRKSGAWINRTPAQLKSDLSLSGTNTGDQTLTSLLPSQSGHSSEFLTTNGTNASWAASGGGGTPGGSDTQVQFNDSLAFGGSARFTFNKSTSQTTITNGSTAIFDLTTEGLVINKTTMAAVTDIVVFKLNGTAKWEITDTDIKTGPQNVIIQDNHYKIGGGVGDYTTTGGTDVQLKAYQNIQLLPSALGGKGAVVIGTATTFSNAPTSPMEGMLMAVTDSSTATWGATITGGGANHVLAYYNGSNWTVSGK